MLEVLYHHAKFDGARISPAAEVAKNHNFGQILTFLGLLYRPPFTDEGQIWCAIADPWYTLMCQMSSPSVYCVALWRRKTPNFAVFRLWHFVVSPVGRNLRKLNAGHMCTTTNLPLSNGIKIVSVLQRLHGEIGRTNS